MVVQPYLGLAEGKGFLHCRRWPWTQLVLLTVLPPPQGPIPRCLLALGPVHTAAQALTRHLPWDSRSLQWRTKLQCGDISAWPKMWSWNSSPFPPPGWDLQEAADGRASRTRSNAAAAWADPDCPMSDLERLQLITQPQLGRTLPTDALRAWPGLALAPSTVCGHQAPRLPLPGHGLSDVTVVAPGSGGPGEHGEVPAEGRRRPREMGRRNL